MGERIVALLPMKAHSERVAGKNFRSFNGRPLFRWLLDTLLSVDQISCVVINTDARSILADYRVNEEDRVVLRDRRSEICGDFVSMNRIIEDDLAAVPADIYVMTHTTNPLLSKSTITRALNQFRQARNQGTADSLFAVNQFQSRFYWKDSRPINHDPTRLARTQDLDPVYEENSNLYVFTARSFAATHARIGARPVMFETPRLESFDIDDEESWRLAEVVGRALSGSHLSNAVRDRD